MRACLHVVGFALLAAGLAVPAPARAQSHGDEAERLFEEGNRLVEQQRWSEACPKLARSQQLDPGIGTEFNLAFCYSKLGRNATAWRMFRDVARAAHAAGKAERESASLERAAALAPKLAHLSLDASAAGVPPADLEIRIDDRVVPDEERSVPYPVDAGDHRVDVIAAARKPWSTQVLGVRDGDTRAVAVPKLDIVATAQRGSSQRTAALVVGGIGVAGLVAGGITGVLSITKHKSARDECPDPNACATQPGADAWTSATTFGTISTVSFVVAGVGLAGAAVLWFTAPRGEATPRARDRATASLWLAPFVGPGAGGAAFGARLP